MLALIEKLPEWAQSPWIWKSALILTVVVLGVPLIRFLTKLTQKSTSARMTVQSSMLVTKAVKYALYVLLVLSLLSQFGVNLTAILGAAGVAGVAIGFASQTSLSNVISGLFLIGERPFQIGDFVEVEGIRGTVDTIGLLSCYLRTTDNMMVRIPNETLVKTKVTNITRHPIRRVNIDIGVSYSEDVSDVLRILQEIADSNPLCLDEPGALILFKGFGASSLDFLLGAWCERSDYLSLKNSLTREVKERFDKEGIEIPFPHLTLAPGKASAQE